MILEQERMIRQEIFQAIRSSVQEIHADKVILEDVHGQPFLFKSQDAQVWARIFYRSMRDFTPEELLLEIKKLWVLMPSHAQLYLFYPELDRQQILRMNGFSDRLSFFEYANLCGPFKDKTGIRICKWVPSMAFAPLSGKMGGAECPQNTALKSSYLQKSRLTPQEIQGLGELSRALKRI